MSFRQKVQFKKCGLEYKEGDNGEWSLVVLDPRLNERALNTSIRMLREGANYVQIKGEVGPWFTRNHLHTVQKLITMYHDPLVNYWRSELEKTVKKYKDDSII